MQETSPLIILGQTSVGKTSTAITLAHKMAGEIISADSMQVYRGMDIGTAKPSLKEREGIPHHLIDIKEPDEDWSVSDFVAEIKKIVPEILARNKTPIIAGGTGLYLWSLLHGYSFPKVPEDKQLRKELESRDLTKLYQILKEVEQMFTQAIKDEKLKGNLKTQTDPEILGRYLITFWCGLNTLRRMYPDKNVLKNQIEMQLAVIS